MLLLGANRHTALGSPQPWCRNEPGGCWDYGTGPECENWGFRSSGAKQHQHGTLGNQNGRW